MIFKNPSGDWDCDIIHGTFGQYYLLAELQFLDLRSLPLEWRYWGLELICHNTIRGWNLFVTIQSKQSEHWKITLGDSMVMSGTTKSFNHKFSILYWTIMIVIGEAPQRKSSKTSSSAKHQSVMTTPLEPQNYRYIRLLFVGRVLHLRSPWSCLMHCKLLFLPLLMAVSGIISHSEQALHNGHWCSIVIQYIDWNLVCLGTFWSYYGKTD